MKQNNVRIVSRIVLLVLIGIAALYVFADEDVPIGAEGITEQADENFNASQFTAQSHEAQAGNVTQIDIDGISQTRHWQGYYGEITGTITLDDAQNWTMYDWYNAEPRGEVYAVPNISNGNNHPTWTSVECFDHDTNMQRWEIYYNMSWNDPDGINETFNDTDHPAFSVGDYNITASSCPSIFTYVNDQAQFDKFSEVLLQTDGYQIIYATIIENDNAPNRTDPVGFDSNTHDFQLIVGEDGTSADPSTGVVNTDTTTYWFYLDLE